MSTSMSARLLLSGVLLAAAGCGCGPGASSTVTGAPEPALDAAACALLDKADALLAQGRYGSIKPLLAPLLELRPVPTRAQWVVGSAALEKGLYTEACERLGDALARQPRYLPMASGLGWARYRSGDHDGARRVWSQVLAVAPRDHRSLFGLGYMVLDEGDVAQARSLVERSLAIAPLDPHALQLLASVQLEEGRYAEVCATVDRVRAVWPSNDEVLWYRAQALEALGRAEDAQEALAQHDRVVGGVRTASTLARRIELGMATESTHVRRVEALIDTGELGRARQALEDGLRAFPASPELQDLQGTLPVVQGPRPR